jgi:hypothetical protein
MMKKRTKELFILAIIVTILVLLVGCSKGTSVEVPIENQAEVGKIYQDGNGAIYSVKYDGCEYLYASGSGKAITHHAGCSNIKHEKR